MVLLIIFIIFIIAIIYRIIYKSEYFGDKGSEYFGNKGSEYFGGKGQRGENYVRIFLERNVQDKIILNNVKLKKKNSTCQIDHVLISRKGVFVIETKNYSGKIYGNAEQEHWRQIIGYNANNTFYNPIKQNLAHVFEIKKVIKRNIPVYNCVIFASGNIEDVNVYEVFTPETFIIFYDSIKDIMGISDIKEIASEINKKTEEDNISDEEHVNNVVDNQRKIEMGICPRCGGRLMIRKGKYGEFYGCSNFPRCKFKKNIDDF